jgi:hypothetical protein
MHDVEGVGRQMRVAGGGTQVLVAEQRLNDPQQHPAFQQMGGRGVPQGMKGAIRGEAARPHGCLKGLVASGRGQGRRPVPGADTQGRGRVCGQYSRNNADTRGASGTTRSWPPVPWRTRTRMR